MNGVTLEKMVFNDGTEINLNPGFIVVLTGPNNCGKSQCLKDIVYHWISNRRRSIVVSDVTRKYIGDLKLAMRFDDLKEIVEDEASPKIRKYIESNGADFSENPLEVMKDVANEGVYLF